MRREDFGPDFRFGVATAAFQIEGALDEGGRGRSIWDAFCEPKKVLGFERQRIKNGDTAEVACDHYHRYADDVRLMAALGVDAYRFSIAWPRILPEGRGRVNAQGVAFYTALLDELEGHGIEPFVTLYHWDLPLALEHEGGWTNRAVVDAFREYVEACADAFGDRVKRWIVLNEGICFTAFGHMAGVHAPGRFLRKNFLPAVHHALLAQADGARALRERCPEAEIGTTVALAVGSPATDTDADREAARRFEALGRIFVDPVFRDGYPFEELGCLRRIGRWVQPGDMERLRFPFDFLGVNHYFRWVLERKRFVPLVGFRPVKSPDAERTGIGWEVYPEGMYDVLTELGRDPRIPPLYVTENGAAYDDVVDADGRIRDEARKSYIERYLAHVLRARQDGVDVRGYFAWTAFDNFEWSEGYGPRFGLYHVDFETQRRTLKDSGAWYRDFLRRGGTEPG